jgi:PAS domain S-box-containing protein
MKPNKKPTYEELEQKLKETQSRALEHQERFRILMLNMDAGVVIHSPDTSIIQNNRRASEILGLSDDQLRGKTAIDPDWKFVYPDKSPLPFEDYPVNQIVAGKTSIKDLQVGIFKPGQDDISWLTVNGFAVLNGTGDLTEIVTVFVDITEQKKQEEEKLANQLKLEKTKKELNQAQKLAHVGNWIFNPGMDKPDWSEEMFRIWGFDPKESAPDYKPDIINRVHPDDQQLFNSAFSKAINPGIPYDIEFRICIPGEGEKIVRSIFEPAQDENGEKIISGTNQDITEQKKFEKDQVRHQRLKAIGEMSSSIAHDFNNALQEMMGNMEVINLESGLSKNALERLNTVKAIINDTAGRVSALQKFGDPKSDENNSRLINLNTLIQESLNQSRPLWKDEMEKKGQRIKVKTNFQEIPKIYCPEGELKTVVFNLIKNGIEAMPEGGEIIIETGTRDDLVYTTFTDTGVGMDAEAKMKLFEPFFTTKGFNPGRGLGMSGAYSIVKNCNGDI